PDHEMSEDEADEREKAGRTKIECEVHPGTKRDAMLYAVGANQTHGQPRSRDDKRKGVARLLLDKEWGAWSDRAIADRCGVSHTFVASVRADLDRQWTDRQLRKLFFWFTDATRAAYRARLSTGNVASRKRKGKDGRTRKAKPTRKAKAQTKPNQEPETKPNA